MEKNKEEQETEEVENEESGLEEDIEEAEEEIAEDKFVEFMTPLIESSSTALNQVAVASELRATDLEQDLSNVIGFQEEKKEEEKKYVTEYIQEDYEAIKEEQRIKNENLLVKQASPINIESIGRGLRPHIEQNFQFNPELQELREGGRNLDKDYVIKTVELNKESRLPFQQEVRKYKGKAI